jgi:hypothetical protein
MEGQMSTRSELATMLSATRDALKGEPEHQTFCSLSMFTEMALRGEMESVLLFAIDPKDRDACVCMSGDPEDGDQLLQGAVDFIAGLLLSSGEDPNDVKSVLCAAVDRCAEAIRPRPSLRLVAGTDVDGATGVDTERYR